MRWQEQYGDRLATAREAAALIHSGDYIATGMLEPVELLRALKDRDDLKEVRIYCSESLRGMIGEVAAETRSDIRAVTSFIHPHPNLLKAYDMGKVDFVPTSFSGWGKLHESYDRCNVLMLAITEPDPNGYVTLSTYPEHVCELIKETPLVIGEVNPKLPATAGGPPVHITEFTKLVESRTGWGCLIRPEVGRYWEDEQARAMGGYLSELIDDGATIELGVGSMNGNAVLNMEGVRDLGIHTEFFGEVLMELMRKGVVNNSRKTCHRGCSVATIGSGSQRYYDFVRENPAIRFLPSREVLDVRAIASNYRMTAINTAAQIDLLGQVNGEFIRGRQYSGIGGQGDFAKGACLCPEGKSIMAMASTTKNGKYSKIVPFFPEQLTPVTTSRTDVEYVVTEYGVAQLAGQTVRQRAENLIRVANPIFRDELTEEARKRKLIP